MKGKINTDHACVPGVRICPSDEQTVAGSGTYERHGYIYSSITGFVHVLPQKDKTTLIEVRNGSEQSVSPSAGDIVTARVNRVSSRFCKCSILCVGDTVLAGPFQGVVRKADVRATEKDRVEMYKCFRPGDVILARVLSIGDAHSFYLSTAESELGVAIAESEAGVPMVPISWTEMQCPKTCNREYRKVAKIISETLPE